MDSMGAFKTESLDGEERYADRHDLALPAEVSASGGTGRVEILNASSTGLLVRSDLPLELGEMIEVDLPHAGAQRARVVWGNDGFYGCALTTPVTRAAVSAARLRSQPTGPASPAAGETPEVSVGERAFAQPGPAYPGQLTLRQKAATIIGLASVSWGVVIAGAMLIA